MRHDKEKTKDRIVFDGSAKVDQCTSLNEALHAGPSLLGGLVFSLFLCRTENLIIQRALENVLIEICHVFNIYYSGYGAS